MSLKPRDGRGIWLDMTQMKWVNLSLAITHFQPQPVWAILMFMLNDEESYIEVHRNVLKRWYMHIQFMHFVHTCLIAWFYQHSTSHFAVVYFWGGRVNFPPIDLGRLPGHGCWWRSSSCGSRCCGLDPIDIGQHSLLPAWPDIKLSMILDK